MPSSNTDVSSYSAIASRASYLFNAPGYETIASLASWQDEIIEKPSKTCLMGFQHLCYLYTYKDCLMMHRVMLLHEVISHIACLVIIVGSQIGKGNRQRKFHTGNK